MERVVEREITRQDVLRETTQKLPEQASTGPRTAAALSRIGALPDRSRLRRIHGLRWR
ncbi:hypothetical protein V8324_14810 [Roseovarius sp. D22-M7]